MALGSAKGPEDVEVRAEILLQEAQTTGDEVSTRLAAFQRALYRRQENNIRTGDAMGFLLFT
eukprot:1885307-Lingulodinium_polyedra.AAC.1